MERSSEKEKSSSRKSREERETTRDSKSHHRHSHSHRSSKDDKSHHRHSHRHDADEDSDDDDHRHHHHRSSRREKSIDRESRREREKSMERDSRRERSIDRRDKSVEREHSRREKSVERDSHKRKDREESEERGEIGEKRVRVSEREERRERRRFEDGVRVEDGNGELKVKEENGGSKGENDAVDSTGKSRGRRRFDDGELAGKSGSLSNDGVAGPLNVSSRAVSESNPANIFPSIKVSSISTTNENTGVNITGSHEVNAKSSTDGTITNAGQRGISLDALAKAKKLLQLQKELNEKMKKIPGASKSSTSESVAPASTGILPTPSTIANMTASGVKASSSVPSVASASVKPLGAIVPVKYEAVRRAQELAAKMGFRQDPEFAPLINLFPGQGPAEVPVLQKPAKAPVLRLDALGREIDEHGNVVNISKPSNLSTLKVNINKQKKDAFQIQKPELEVDPEKNPHFDPRMGIDKNKILRPKRMSFQFVEEGRWSKEAEMMKLKNQFGEAQAKELKAKQAQLAKAKAEPNINPNLIEVSERVFTKDKEKQKEPIPEVEWWDVPLLRAGNYADIVDGENIEDKLKMEKLTIYVEHPRPIEPPAEPAPPPPQPLKLTKKEQKKLRTQKRLAREKERQEMIRQGLLEPPKPKVKMSNLMKVLGSEATQDPTKLEMEIRAAAAEREQAHVDRNIARKLTPAERREKKERKLFDDPNTLETIVSIYKINDLSHPKNRFKVDVNAHENRLTGCAVIYEGGFSVVVVEGGKKPNKRYEKLMLRRINWAEKPENVDEEEDEDEEKPANKCSLVWQGSVAKPSFNRFSVHECRTEAAARKVFLDAGVGHYWDQAANFSDDQI